MGFVLSDSGQLASVFNNLLGLSSQRIFSAGRSEGRLRWSAAPQACRFGERASESLIGDHIFVTVSFSDTFRLPPPGPPPVADGLVCPVR